MSKSTVIPHHQVALLHQTHLVETWGVKLELAQEGTKGKEEDEAGALLSPGLSTMALISHRAAFI